MTEGATVLDSDTLSELARGNAKVVARAREYAQAHGRLTITALSVFERLRGYRAAIAEGKPYQTQLAHFQAFAANCIVLPFDDAAADRAALLWAGLSRKHRRSLADILIAATAAAHGCTLATRNRRDFEPMVKIDGGALTLVDWTR